MPEDHMPKQILIVEDHVPFRRNLRGWLETEFPDCSIIEATSGEQALEIVQNSPPQVVLVDITLPHMNGIAVTRQIKAIHPSAPVVVLTIHQDEVYRADALAAGAAAYVTKQAMYSELLPVLKLLIYETADPQS